MKKDFNMTLWQLIASRLLIHIIAAILLIFLSSFLLNYFCLPVYTNYPLFPVPGSTIAQLDLQEYEAISENLLTTNDASLLVLNEDLSIIKSINGEKSCGYTYSAEELNTLLLNKKDSGMLFTEKFKNEQQETVIVLLQINQTILELLQEYAQHYAFLHLLLSGILVLLVCFSFIRSIYRPLQQNLSCISRNIAKTAYDTSRVNPSDASLQETRLVLHTYNTMLDEMEQIKKEKESTEQKSRRLIANLSHDLKSPMTSLRGYAELLEQEHLTSENQRTYLQYIHSNIAALNSMVELLSEQVKYQYHDYSLHLEYKDINNFLREICASYYTIFEKQGFEMSVDIPEIPHYIEFDAINMRRVFSNLLDNIISHNPDPIPVQISAKQYQKTYCIQIKDNGVGIAPKNHDKIFEPFFQGDESRTKQHSGLGLFLTKQILEKHHASICLESEPHYKTIFTIRFPIRDE